MATSSSDFNSKIDRLILDINNSINGIYGSREDIINKGKRDLETYLFILSSLKEFKYYSVQSDWNQLDNTAPDFIKNKPTSLGGGTNSNVLIDAGSYLAPNENLLIDCGSYL